MRTVLFAGLAGLVIGVLVLLQEPERTEHWRRPVALFATILTLAQWLARKTYHV